ncbi:hypothetical protein MA16_Dca029236 [Dendrobium catenatum]|uniref:Uncharacterized protein n=1 Tax=Dendrobium catenatum TaxID=906689 RepID=A0A2I0VD61_9ASPA|nr:hypothetical protein MA16_Dca029236 [Dendrobium catenatum]
MKCSYLLNLSTTTKITVNPFEWGNLSINSMEISSHTLRGRAKGCSNPPGDITMYLFLW